MSANPEELQDKTRIRAVIQASLAPYALQEAGLLYKDLLPDQWSTWTDTKGN